MRGPPQHPSGRSGGASGTPEGVPASTGERIGGRLRRTADAGNLDPRRAARLVTRRRLAIVDDFRTTFGSPRWKRHDTHDQRPRAAEHVATGRTRGGLAQILVANRAFGPGGRRWSRTSAGTGALDLLFLRVGGRVAPGAIQRARPCGTLRRPRSGGAHSDRRETTEPQEWQRSLVDRKACGE
jgi:hypothetical protein